MRRAPFESDLLEALRVGLAAWQSENPLALFLAQPPWNVPDGVTVTERRNPLLKTTGRRRQPPMLARWPEHGLHSSQYPYLGFLVEGEADLSVGVTHEMAKSLKKGRGIGTYVLSIPAGSFFVVAPGVPYADGSGPHWERPDRENAYSRILWITVYPTGLALHSCTSRGESHSPSSSIFIWDARALTMSGLLIEALQTDSPQAGAIAKAHLGALLLRMEQEWLRGRTCSLNPRSAMPQPEGVAKEAGGSPDTGLRNPGSMHQNIVQGACNHIESHLATVLTLEDIAAHAYVSVAQLNRLFRAELKMSVMEFVTQRRVQTAQFLLRESELSIGHICLLSGYARANYFSRIFTKCTGVTPTEYRNGAEPTNGTQ